jgi:hypothetical protein
MTIRYEYKCNTCANNYIEQRGKDEPNAFFTTCFKCEIGTYEETGHTVLSLEPERVAVEQPEEIVELEKLEE